jgi:hypothetical protein
MIIKQPCFTHVHYLQVTHQMKSSQYDCVVHGVLLYNNEN